jgi:non-homologous end joining protein Ku
MPIRSGILSFRLVAIPVKVYPATKVRFNLLHAYRLLADTLEKMKRVALRS